MRRVTRPALTGKPLKYLAKKRTEVGIRRKLSTLDIKTMWERARQTKAVEGVLEVLRSMAGSRWRCMYCLDSHGTDIEHFWPKAIYPGRMFQWHNMLLCCTDCGRLKSNYFPRDGLRPLLVNPAKEDPWQYLDFDPVTGNLSARYDLATNDYSPKGEKTVEYLHFDRREALAAGYSKTYRRLVEEIEAVLALPLGNIDDIVERIVDRDDHFLLGWAVRGSGYHEDIFVRLRTASPQLWNALAAKVS